jgi:hypothetical protein
MTDPYDKPPCCGADALRQVKIIPVNGIPTGIVMLEKILDELKPMNITDEARLKDILLEKVTIYNYIPKGSRDAYVEALLREYRAHKRTGT